MRLALVICLLAVTARGATDTCATRFAADDGIETRIEQAYEQLLTTTAAGLVGADDLRALLQPGSLFRLPEAGRSERGAVSDGLARLGAWIEARGFDTAVIEKRLRGVVERRLAELETAVERVRIDRERHRTVRRHDRVLEGHTGAVLGLAYSRDGKVLYSAGADEIFRVWDLAQGGKLRWNLAIPGTAARHLVSDAAGGWWAAGSSGPFHYKSTANRYFLAAGDVKDVFEGVAGEVAPVHTALSPDGTTAAVATRNGLVALWDLAARQRKTTFVVTDGPEWGPEATGLVQLVGARVTAMAFSPDSGVLAVHFENLGTQLRDGRTGAFKMELEGATAPFHDMALSADGKWVAGHARAGAISLWSAETGKRLPDLAALSPGEAPLAFSADSHYLAVGARGEIHLFETTNWTEVGRLVGNRMGPNVLAFSPDGKWLTVGYQDHTIVTWDAAAYLEEAGL